MARKDNTSPTMAKDNHDSESCSGTAGSAASPENSEVTEVNRPIGTTSQASPTEPYDPFAEENIRLPQELLDEAVSHTELTIVPVQKPSDQQFIRVHPDPDYRHIAALIELQEEQRAKYLIHPACVAQVKAFGIKFHFEQLYLYVTKQGDVCWWPMKLPTTSRENRWLDSARDAAEKAIGKWISVRSNMALGAYIVSVAIDNDEFHDPEWPNKTKNQLLALAFRERLILDVEHPVIRKLRGANVK